MHVWKRPNKTEWEMSFKCLLPMSCLAFMLQARLLSFITHLYVRVCAQAFPFFSFFFEWASRNKCVIQRECQLFTLNNVRGLKGCRGALGLKQTCDIWSKSQKSILLLLGKSNQGLNQVTPHRLNHTNNKKIVIPASWPLHFLFTISSLILFLWC